MPSPDIAKVNTRDAVLAMLADGRPWTTVAMCERLSAMGGSAIAARSCAIRMFKAGHIGAIRRGWDWIYFRDQQTANACPESTLGRIEAEMKALRIRRAKEAGKNTTFGANNSARTGRRAVDATVTITAKPAHQPGEADYSRAKLTVAPPVRYDARYQVDPKSSPYGAGFAAIGPGRDVTTGRSWGA